MHHTAAGLRCRAREWQSLTRRCRGPVEERTCQKGKKSGIPYTVQTQTHTHTHTHTLVQEPNDKTTVA